ncbi:hypothetical protein C2S52_013579 [Perilla frutescens var. hirtella]|nr:hypothetical protein C2S52_013579 [Perilla frutescens var. hirtella]
MKANESLRDSESLISNGNRFKLSFFSPPNSSSRYVGIMFNLPVMTVVWVANRNKPLNDSMGTFKISSDGNLVILDGRKETSFIWKDGYPYFRTGPWNGQRFTGLPHMESDFNIGANVVRDSPGIAYLIYTHSSSSDLTYFNLNSSGHLVLKLWSDEKTWDVAWSLIRSECDMYGKCGPFGSCKANHKPICTCFPGFVPTNKDEWEAGNWTTGCKREVPLQCERNDSLGKQDEFLKVKGVKVPDHFKWYPSLEGDCKGTCLSNCSCKAYANPSGIGCLQWTETLTDAQEFTYGGDDLYIRLAYSGQDKKNDRRTIIATTVVLGSLLIAVCTYLLPKLLLNYRAKKRKNKLISSKIKGTDAGYSEESRLKHDKHGVKLEEVPLFKFEILSNATEKFDPVNKLGQGGFGAVYKVWKLWNDGKIVTLMDPSIYNAGMEGDIVRYANVGLLCVQEVAADRPNISTVLSMLSCEIIDFPCPKEPAFLKMQMSRGTESSIESSGKGSTNDVTISIVERR